MPSLNRILYGLKKLITYEFKYNQTNNFFSNEPPAIRNQCTVEQHGGVEVKYV